MNQHTFCYLRQYDRITVDSKKCVEWIHTTLYLQVTAGRIKLTLHQLLEKMIECDRVSINYGSLDSLLSSFVSPN